MMNEELLKTISPAGATVVTGIFGMLTTVIGFYQWHRKADDDKERELSKRKETENDSE
jgi:nicotinamide riboside transporter PnuC